MLFFSEIAREKFSKRQLKLWRRYAKFEREFYQAELELTPYRLNDVVEDTAKRLFPELTAVPKCIFCKDIALAYIVRDAEPPRIQISPLLNTPKTPRPVIEYIITHELLHLLIRPREIDGKMVVHPPEFWERESVLSPCANDAWSWILLNYAKYLKTDEEHGCYYVDLVAQKKGVNPRLSYDQAIEKMKRWEHLKFLLEDP